MEDTTQPWEGPLHILSLDGGGIKGLFSAAVLAKLEEDLDIDITDHFDLIVGTSTGGIIAIGLGMGIRPRELVDFYLNHGLTIFHKKPLGWSKAQHWFCRKYSNHELRTSLKKVLGNKILGESTKRLVIPTYNLDADDVRLFKTPHHDRLRGDWKIEAWKIAMATSAAPTYFPAFREIDDQRLIDGGVWANNPTMVGITEACALLNASLDQVRVLSLGTCDDVVRRPDRLNAGGLISWRQDGVKVVMRGQSVGMNKMASLLFPDDRVCRIDPKVPDKLFRLDRTDRMDKLMAYASHSSQHFGPRFVQCFLPHKASAYTPLYPAEGAGS
ncbi:MAG: CBASS cGAMP-activated phospholipase [Phycisphaerales bacterium JB060]